MSEQPYPGAGARPADERYPDGPHLYPPEYRANPGLQASYGPPDPAAPQAMDHPQASGPYASGPYAPDPYAAGPYASSERDGAPAQQWQGGTWQPAGPVAETAYPPQPQAAAYGVSYGPPDGGGAPGAPAGTGAFGSAADTAAGHGTPSYGASYDTGPHTASGAAYGPGTVGGNARITDAQRARAEGRSPVIEPGIRPAGLTAVLGLLLAGGAAAGPYALLVPVVVLQAVTAAGWFRLNGMWPARQGIVLAFVGGLVADAVLLSAGRDHAPAAILGTLGVWVLLTLVLQLRSHASPDERMYGLMATVASAALAVVVTGHLAAEPDAVVVGAIAVAVAVLVRALPLPVAGSVAVGLLAAAGAGFVAGGLTDYGTRGALLGLGAAVCALAGHRAASYDYPSRFVHMTAGVALPLAAAAPAIWLLGRVLA